MGSDKGIIMLFFNKLIGSGNSLLKRLKLRMHHILQGILGNNIPTKPLTHCNTLLIGDSSYGAWTICPDRIVPGGVIYSFGVGEDIDWDLAMIEKFGVTIHAFDPTPRSANFVKQQKLPNQFIFHEYGIADYDGVAHFYPPENPDWVSHSLLKRDVPPIEVQVKRLKTIMECMGHEQIDLIKMDIEGAEYPVLSDMLDSEIILGGAEQVLVEFHHRFSPNGSADTIATLHALKKKGYKSFNISPNGEEWSFLHDRVTDKSK